MPNKKVKEKKFTSKILSDDVLSIDDLLSISLSTKKTSPKKAIKKSIKSNSKNVVKSSPKKAVTSKRVIKKLTPKKSKIKSTKKSSKVIEDIVFEKPEFKLVEFKHDHLLDVDELNTTEKIKNTLPKITSIKKSVDDFNSNNSKLESSENLFLNSYQDFTNTFIKNWFNLFKV
tara:strand:+ start:45305 stop:45823 length:519 start_codon:yes stop_codon:yes gene_type:complete